MRKRSAKCGSSGGGGKTVNRGRFGCMGHSREGCSDKSATPLVSWESDLSKHAQRMKKRAIEDEDGRGWRQGLRFCYAEASRLSGRTEGHG